MLEGPKITPLAENTNNNERRSLDFFIALREKMLSTTGILDVDEFDNKYYHLEYHIFSRENINNALKLRQEKDGFSKIKEKLKDVFRKNGENLHNGYGIPDYQLENVSLSGLNGLKNFIKEKIEYYKKFKTSFDVLKDAEYDPYVKEILSKYKKESIYELLDEDCPIEDRNEISVVFRFISHAFKYRNRKINEFVAYRYARTASISNDVEDFIKNTHTILGAYADNKMAIQNQYRDSNLKSDNHFFAPLGSRYVESSMHEFNSHVNDVEKTNNILKNQKEALKAYVLFEIIHPFKDGNGRTGRSLFVYLQRYFSKDQKINITPLHIPIARFESGTIEGKSGHRQDLGSLSREVGEFLQRIIQSKEIKNLFKEFGNSIYSSVEEEIKNSSHFIVENLISILSSKENDVLLDDFLEVIKKQSALDDMKSEDLNMVYESMNNALKETNVKKSVENMK